MNVRMLKALASMALAWGFAVDAIAVTPLEATPFSIVGFIQTFVTGGSGFATMTVNGTPIVIPINTMVTMPGQFLNVSQLFSLAPAPFLGAGRTGLALDDESIATNKPFVPFEANVTGNIVPPTGGGQFEYRAALVSIAQLGLMAGTGYVTSINPTLGELTVCPATNTPNPLPLCARVRLNDPQGKYSILRADPVRDDRFTVDTENSPVRAITGYPMCIPQVAPDDPNCPVKNRNVALPTDPPPPYFVMGPSPLPAPIAGEEVIAACPACDPTLFAPFMVGDLVTYNGMVVKDPSGGYLVYAHAVAAWVGIYTQRGVDPAYVNFEVTLLGTGRSAPPFGLPWAPAVSIDIEAANRFKFEGFTTDPSRDVVVYAVDGPSGTETVRAITRITPQAVPFGRWRQALNKTFLVGPPREVLVRIVDGMVITDGVTTLASIKAAAPKVGVGGAFNAGLYQAPVGEHIFPENTRFGTPVVPANVECLPFLLTPKLAPWPGAPSRDTTPPVCTP